MCSSKQDKVPNMAFNSEEKLFSSSQSEMVRLQAREGSVRIVNFLDVPQPLLILS